MIKSTLNELFQFHNFPVVLFLTFVFIGFVMLIRTAPTSGETKPHPKPDYYMETIQGHQYIVFHNQHGTVKAVVPNKACPACHQE